MSACSIDREPHGSLSSNKITENPDESVDAMVRGVYAQLKTWSDPMHRCGEYAGDNIMIRGASTDAFFEFITFNRTPDNYRLDDFWNSSYKAIAQASNAIKLYQDKTDDNVKAKVGECYFVRGMIYFYLVRAYGRPYYQDPKTNLGVPIVNGTPKDVFDKFTLPDRATVADTYQQAIADLKKAEELLPETNGNPGYASKGAAQAMLSKVYLFMSGTYEHPNTEYARLAAEYASKVISSGKYALLSRDEFMKYPTILPQNNKESIFVVRRLASEYSGYDHYYGIGGMYANIGGMGWGEMYASGKYLALLDETGRNDYRPNHKQIIDARAAFIEPAYDEKNIEVFRFIKQETNGDFNYLQLPTKHDGDKIVATESKTTEGQKEITQDYVLTPILAEQGRYSIVYADGKTYQGVIDNKIKLNRAYPMFYIAKCSREGENSHLHSPVLSRLGEIYLNRAEAEAKIGNYAAALTDLNIIRERAITGGGYKSLDASNAAERIDKERQLELAFQAERSYDVFRNGGSLTRHYPGAHNQKLDILPTDYRVVYFIPQDAINAYPGKLTQNPTH
ncbi:MAG: RagB/SusD family nutrient uptake outer membrane protein [Porphyromonas sp.]|nr:RagB/SusD family nutrient uptake outer membrane protein [Porphyromonas sp.]